VVRIRLEFKREDLWIGAYWKTRAWIRGHDLVGNVVDLWICLIPCLPVHVSWVKGRWWLNPEPAPHGERGRGLYRKYSVHRLDGRDRWGQKHHGCEYFVLDLTHDPYAIAAVRAYADSCKADYPALAADLSVWSAQKRLGIDPSRN
jgi:hypothetical protein